MNRNVSQPGIDSFGPAHPPHPINLTSTLERFTWLLLCCFVFTIPWEKGVWVGGIGTIARTVGLVAFLAGVAAIVQRRAVRTPNAVFVCAALFVLWSAATWFWSVHQVATLARGITLAQLLAMMWLLWEFCLGHRRQQQLLRVFLLGAVAGAGITFVRYAMDIQTYYRRYAATGFDPNTFGLILALAIPIALYLALGSRNHVRWLYYAAALLLISAVLLTASRTALIATFIGFAFVPLTWRHASASHRIASCLLFFTLVLSLGGLAPASSRDRLATIPSEITTGTFNSRKQIWKSGARAWLERPMLGVGAGAFPEAVVPWLGRPTTAGMLNVAHNSFLSVLVECGIVGFLVFSLMLALLAMFVWMLPSVERMLWLVILVAWAAGVLTLTWEHHKASWLIFSLVPTSWARAWLPWRQQK